MITRSKSNLNESSSSSTVPTNRSRRRRRQRNVPELRDPPTPITEMADQRTMQELLQCPTEGYGDAIVLPQILSENFELKTGLIQLVTSNQFQGFERDDPHAHIRGSTS